MDLTVSIASTNEAHYIKPLLETLYQAAPGIEMEVLVIDNACDDDTAALAQGNYPGLRVVRNTARKPFTVNHNIGIEQARGKYVLILNPDILFEKGEPCLQKMVDFMNATPQCGVSGCRVYNFDKEFAYPARRYQSLRIILSRRFAKLFFSKKVDDYYLYKDRPITDTFSCDWLSGCFLFGRREALLQAGGFDTGYTMYFEDVDICHMVRKAGWDVMYHGDTFYYHLEQRASMKLFSRKARQHIRSWLRWIFMRRLHLLPPRPAFDAKNSTAL